jgi:hypothetical protein
MAADGAVRAEALGQPCGNAASLRLCCAVLTYVFEIAKTVTVCESSARAMESNASRGHWLAAVGLLRPS